MEDFDFGVFYTCYTEVAAVDYSLDILLKFYPKVPIFLISDGGSDYSFLKNKIKNIEILLEEDSRSFIPKISKDNFKEDFWQEKIKKSILIFLDRIERSIKYCGKKYTLIMEPDVLVRGKIKMPNNSFLAGSRLNSGLSDELKNVLKSIDGAIEINNWGATPALFCSESFLKAYTMLKNNMEILNNICMSEYRLSNYDILLPVLFSLIGIEETFNPQIVECFRCSKWETVENPLVHQYRAKYPLKSEGYNGTHVNHVLGIGDYWPWKR